MAKFFRGVGDWPLSDEDAVTLGVNTKRAELTDGWCQKFLDEYEIKKSVRGEYLLEQTVQRGVTYRGTPRESISALLITLATANEIALRRNDEYITEPEEIGRAVRKNTNLTDVQIRIESIGNPEQLRRITEAIIDGTVSGSDRDAWLSELEGWLDENSVLVKRVFRGISREFADSATLDTLKKALEPALGGKSIDAETLTTDHIEEAAHRFARAKELFRTDDGETLWQRFTNQADNMQQLYSTAEVTGRMQTIVEGSEIPDAENLRATLNKANTHRRNIVREQYERIAGEVPTDNEPESIVASLVTWLHAHDRSSKATADRIIVEFEAVTVDDLYDLFETAWDGDNFSEADLVNSAVVQQTEQHARARRLLGAPPGMTSLWSQLQETASRLEDEHPHHPVTGRVNKLLARSQPPTVDEVEALLEAAEQPFALEERLAELAEELQVDFPDHELTSAVIDALAGDSLPSDERMSELIERAEQLLEGVSDNCGGYRKRWVNSKPSLSCSSKRPTSTDRRRMAQHLEPKHSLSETGSPWRLS